jgi:hypothetical protein
MENFSEGKLSVVGTGGKTGLAVYLIKGEHQN